MYLSRLARLKHLEEADVEAEGQAVVLRIQYAQGPEGEPAYWGPTYVYRLGEGSRLWEEATHDDT